MRASSLQHQQPTSSNAHLLTSPHRQHHNTLFVPDQNLINHNHINHNIGNGPIQYDDRDEDYDEQDQLPLDQDDDESWHALDLSNMGLRHLAPSISLYPHLTALYLSHNSLSDLPSVLFTHLPSLVYLDLSYNLFTHLPAQIGELEWLEELVLYNNKIVNLPWTIGRLSRLKNLILGENPLMWPPMQIVQVCCGWCT